MPGRPSPTTKWGKTGWAWVHSELHVLDLRRSHLGMQTWHRLGVALAHHTRSDSFDQLPAAAWSKIRLALCHLQQHVLRYKVSHVLYALLSCLSPTAQGCRVGRLWGRLLWRQPGVSRQSPQPVGGYQHAHTHSAAAWHQSGPRPPGVCHRLDRFACSATAAQSVTGTREQLCTQVVT